MTLIELRQNILRRLGSPVINVELANEQIDLYIEDCLEKFIEVHYDGLDEGFIFLDTVPDQNEYTIPSNIHSVLEIMTMSSTLMTDEPLLVNPYLVGNSYSSGSPNILDLIVFDQNISQFRNIMRRTILFQFNSMTGILTIHKTPTDIIKLALRVHSFPSNKELIYENKWVQKYSTALCKIAWGENIGKFEGATLPGGIALNYSRIIQEGQEEKEKLEEELYSRYSEPPDFFISG